MRIRHLFAQSFAAVFALRVPIALAQQPTTQPPSTQPQAFSARIADGTWTLTTLAASSSELPDTPSLRIAEVGEAWVRRPDEVVFWGRLTTPRETWALFSWKSGTIRTLAEEGDKVVSKYAFPGMTDQLSVYHKKGLHLPLDVFSGTLGYLVSRPGAFKQRSFIYTWDGNGIRRLIGYPDTIVVQGATHRVGSAEVERVGRNGDALLRIYIDEPKKLFVHAAYDGGAILPLSVNEPLAFGDERAFGFSCAHLVNGPALIACPVAKSTGKATSVQIFTPNGARPLISVGDVKPVGGVAEATPNDVAIGSWVELFDVRGRDQYLGVVGVPFVSSGGKIYPVPGAYAPDATGRGQLKGLRPDGPYVVGGVLLDSLGPTSLLLAIQRGTATKPGEERYRFDVFLFDGTSLKRLTSPDVLIDETSGFRMSGGDFPAVLVYERLKGKEIAVREVSLTNPAEGWSPPLLFNVGPARTVSTADVLGWLSAGQAVVRQADGLYLLKRQP